MSTLFDHRLLALRRDRAVKSGTATFLFDRAFDDCLERLALIKRPFHSALLAGCPIPEWPQRVNARSVVAVDPGPLMATNAGAQRADLECLPFEAAGFDLVITIGLLDTANDLAFAASALHRVLRPGGLLIGAIAGGHSLPRLRAAMLAADSVLGAAGAHVHPRVEAGSLAHLLTGTGFAEPVVDVDRIEILFSSLDGLVRDLRAMGSTNILRSRPKTPLTRRAADAARSAFLAGETRASETIEILHFAGWKPQREEGNRNIKHAAGTIP